MLLLALLAIDTIAMLRLNAIYDPDALAGTAMYGDSWYEGHTRAQCR